MRICPRCGFANLDENERCLKCQARLGHHDIVQETPTRLRRFDPAGLQRRATRLWQTLTDWMRPRLPAELPHRRPATAVVLSLVPGLGQIYNRQPLKAVWFTLAWAALLALAIWTFLTQWSYPTLFAWLGLWLWMANDALVTAIRINGQAWTPRHSWGTAFAIVTMMAFAWFILLTAMSPFLYFRLIGQDDFAPLFKRGDFIWLDKWCLWFGGEPRRGEYIYYDPAGFLMHRMRDAYAYDAENFIGRVIGLPGETVVVDHAEPDISITVNGKPLPRDLYPPFTQYLPGHREFHVPPDRWLILQTHTMTDGFVQAITGVTPAPSLSGADLDPEKSWTKSNYVSRDQMIGRVFAISHPPERRRWFPRGERER
jgi:TM2 domain-containing membrane protein YozV